MFSLLLIPIIVAVATQLGFSQINYILIALIIGFWFLVSLDKIPERFYKVGIYAFSLSLMWSASMVGVHIIGSDMAGEYYVVNQVMVNGWNIAADYGTQTSTSVVIGWFVPIISKILHIDPVWVFKIILPSLFAFVPVILYSAFRRQFGSKIALYSAFFFMIVPVTTLEVVQIGKAMVAEIFLALAILILTTKTRWYLQLISLSACAILALWSHYTVGLALLAYLLGIGLFKLVTFWWKRKRVISVVVVSLSLVVSGIFGYYYFKVADGGSVLGIVSRIFPSYGEIAVATVTDSAQTASIADIYIDPITGRKTTGIVESVGDVPGYRAKFERNEGLVKMAVGWDFMSVGIWGKVFRVVQYITQILILIGAVYILFKGLVIENVAGVSCALVILALCVFLPQFSMIINITRFYHLALFFLAPMLMLGLIRITKNKYAPALILSVYFIFTSGLVYELSRWDVPDSYEVPYSIGLSSERTGVVAFYQQSDVDVVKWLAYQSDQDTIIVGDYNGWHLVSAYIGLKRLREEQVAYNPTFESLPDKPAYIFVTDWNTRHRQYVESIRGIWGGAGLRETAELPDFTQYKIMFKSGNSIVYYKE